MPGPAAPRTRAKLEIRCSGRAVNPLNNQPRGRVCGIVFESPRAYRSRAAWMELARTAGWRVSDLHPDKTVTAICPPCVAGKRRRRKKES
jgi:acetaldehyde dehydrogenase (acetylating)